MQKKTTVVFTGKEQLEIREDEIAHPADDELLIETKSTLISSGTEMIVFQRNFSPGTGWDNWVKYPFTPGYLNAGRVLEVGKNVTDWKAGDRVASRAVHSSHVLVEENLAVRIPDEVNDVDASWMGLGQITQIGVRASTPQMGDAVVVIGLGLLGQLVVQYARLMGAEHVIAIDTAPMRCEMAKAHGATRVLQMTAQDALPEVLKITSQKGADTVYDVTGHPAAFSAALQLARRFGTVVILGDTGTPERQHLTHDVINRGLKIVGAHDGHPPELPHELARWSQMEMRELFLQFLARKQMNVSDLITHRFPFSQAEDAYALLDRERETAMGVVFNWEL